MLFLWDDIVRQRPHHAEVPPPPWVCGRPHLRQGAGSTRCSTRCFSPARKHSALRAGGRTFAESETLSDAGKAAVGATLNDRGARRPEPRPVCHQARPLGTGTTESFPQVARERARAKPPPSMRVFWPVRLPAGRCKGRRRPLRIPHVGAGRPTVPAQRARPSRLRFGGAAWASVFRTAEAAQGLQSCPAWRAWPLGGGWEPAAGGIDLPRSPAARGYGRDDLGSPAPRSGPCCELQRGASATRWVVPSCLGVSSLGSTWPASSEAARVRRTAPAG